jgi:hypothetical protein
MADACCGNRHASVSIESPAILALLNVATYGSATG